MVNMTREVYWTGKVCLCVCVIWCVVVVTGVACKSDKVFVTGVLCVSQGVVCKSGACVCWGKTGAMSEAAGVTVSREDVYWGGSISSAYFTQSREERHICRRGGSPINDYHIPSQLTYINFPNPLPSSNFYSLPSTTTTASKCTKNRLVSRESQSKHSELKGVYFL